MLENQTWRMGYTNVLSVVGIGLLLMALGGCAGDAPKPAPTMTPDQVRSNADKTFDTLEQEQKNRFRKFGDDAY